MPISSMKCPKCGMTQMLRDACKSCGAPVPAHGRSAASAPTAPSPKVHALVPPRDPEATVVSRPVKIKAIEPETAPAAGENEGELHVLRFHGKGGALFGIHIVNLFLTLLTFGFYLFWGRVRVRNYLLGQTEFKEDRFAYHGTGRELLFGFLKGFVAFGSVFALLNAAPILPGGIAVRAGVAMAAYLLLWFLVPAAIVGSRRYRLSRTSWRGIRFSFRGELREFIKIFILGSVLSVLTFGLYLPIFQAKQQAFLTSNSYFGNRRFGFDGRGQDLLFSFLLALLLTIPTLGLCWFWYLAKRHRYYWSHTTFEGARFESTFTGAGLLGLSVVNLLLLVISFGLAWPWVAVRKIRYTFENLSLKGIVALQSVQQEAQEASATGEGLGGLLEIQSDFGVA